MNLTDMGWNDFFQANFNQYKEPGLFPARIIRENKELYQAIGEGGEFAARVSGNYRFRSDLKSDFPAVGDWVAVSRQDNNDAIIHYLLPRKSCFSRRAVLVEKTDEQVLAANIDIVFITTGLDIDFNIRRIERYLSITWDSGAKPVIVLNKADLCPNIEVPIEQVKAVSMGAPVYAVSAIEKTQIDVLKEYLKPGTTVAFLGSSGVGKSSLINLFLGESRQKTSAISEYNGKGRHTTSSRELIFLPDGGIVIDTPGMRVIQAWDDEAGLEKTFSDIENLAAQCRFNDCRHINEPGCAVIRAITDGTLNPGRLNNYLKLKREWQTLQVKKEQRARLGKRANELRWKKIAIARRSEQKYFKKMNRKRGN